MTKEEQLQKYFIPSVVGKAAEIYAVVRQRDHSWQNEIEEAFKAGVEWMAKRGETHETEIVSRVAQEGLLPAVTCLVDKGYREGDKVIVTIRKK